MSGLQPDHPLSFLLPFLRWQVRRHKIAPRTRLACRDLVEPLQTHLYQRLTPRKRASKTLELNQDHEKPLRPLMTMSIFWTLLIHGVRTGIINRHTISVSAMVQFLLMSKM